MAGRDEGTRLENRLDSAYQTIDWWKSVGCEACFVATGRQERGHGLETCSSTECSGLARSILGWLKGLSLPRSLEYSQGFCTMCTHTWQPCTDVSVSNHIYEAESQDEGDYWRREYESGTGTDGHCERKPVARRAIAALCAYDEQFIGKLVASLALDEGADLTAEQDARAWFEQRVPFQDS
ncbi:hypothetical protein PT974_03097 [Cladobotryum mycophilum]